jgi:hypothetical protein
MPTSEKNKTLVVDADNTIYERKEHNNKYVSLYYNGDKSLAALYERDGEAPGKETGKYRFSTVNDSGLDNLSRLQPSAILVTKPGMTLENVVDSFLGANREMLLLPLQLANGGIASNEELPVGFQVQVPNGFFESRFNASVQREADISRIVGDMGPTMLTPEFDEPSFGIKEVLPMAIAAAVAAVVMIYAPQFAPAALSILSKTAAGAAALTAGEIARQASSIALNTQQGIDMEKLGKQAIIGAITGGAAGASQVASQTMLGTTLDKATQGQQIMASMQTAAAVNLSQQLADKSASFSWNQLVCDMLLSAVGTVEARKIPQFDSMLKQYAAEVATVLVNAGLSAAMAKALQNKEISPQAFTIGLASQIAASAPKAWDTVSGNRERIAAQSQKAENIKTPVQQRETKMEAKRQTEQQKAKTNAPVKSVASAKKARSENKGSATKKPVLTGYKTTKPKQPVNMDWMHGTNEIGTLSELRGNVNSRLKAEAPYAIAIQKERDKEIELAQEAALAKMGIAITLLAIAPTPVQPFAAGARTVLALYRMARSIQRTQNTQNSSAIKSTGGRQYDSMKAWEQAEEEAIEFYKQIKISSNEDVKAISFHTNIPEYRINRIKQHLFFKEHKLTEGRVSTFDHDIEIADAWRRLQTGKYVEEDLNLLQHEYFESKFESLYSTDYITAHKAAESTGRKWQPENVMTTTLNRRLK